MRHALILFAFLLTATLSQAQAVIRVQNGQSIESIIDNSTTVSGTVLLLDPGSYAGFTVKKRVSIIGSGYFNGTNASVITGAVVFSENNLTNSDNSLLLGCTADRVNANRNNIVIQRCRFLSKTSISGFAGINIATVNNCRATQCYVEGSIYIDDRATNFLVSNNIVFNQILLGAFYYSLTGKIVYNTVLGGSVCSPLSYNSGVVNEIIVSNNIFISPIQCDNRDAQTNFRTNFLARFNNNIIRQGNYQSNDPSNKFLTTENMALALFTTTATSADGQYVLNATSPAKGAGEGGTDSGAFGGPEPYVIGGSPLGPTITDLQVPSTARQNETIQIRLKARVQN